MTHIADLLPESNIVLDVEATSKKRLFEQIGQLFENHAQIARSVVFESLFARERLGSTGLGQGIAIPHGRIKGLARALGAFVRPLQPIPFDAPDGKPVEQVFVLLVPERSGRHRDRRDRHPSLVLDLDCRSAMNEDRAMRQVSFERVVEDNQERLGLEWIAGRQGGTRILTGEAALKPTIGQVGHMNFIHPFRVQLIGAAEAAHLRALPEDALQASISRLFTTELVAIIVANGEKMPPHLREECDKHDVALLTSPQPSPHLVDVIRLYLSRVLAESTSLHGVFLDVLEMGVLITGASAIGKSELALELISRGNGLVADDIVELYRISPDTLEGRCPAVLKDFLEVRGIGVLNIRTIFGETAVRPRKLLKLMVHLEDHSNEQFSELDRLQVSATYQEILAVPIRKVTIPVAAGRNLAVLVEAAVRNFVLNQRGIDSTKEFIERQQKLMEDGI